ncbi:hypothetical protein HanPI659440_Chr10g0379111 [Helianthus annuus]|nr:hypothetical protein HanPI659440_Chr10g0379111 [Helianthus annuus]
MTILWRALFTIEEVNGREGLQFDVPELAYVYTLVTHGSNRFLFKSKPHQPIPVLKTTKNDSSWKNQFFFIKTDSLPEGDTLPVRWISKVKNFANLAELPGTVERAKAFLDVDSIDRAFKVRIHDPTEDDQISSTHSMSSKQLEFSYLKIHHEKGIAEYEETLTGIRSAAAAKDKTTTKLEKDKRDLEEQLLHAEVGIHEAAMNATDEAKVCAARAIVEVRIKMAQEANDCSFNRSTWEVASWEMALKDLGIYEELEQAAVDAGDARTSGALKDAGEKLDGSVGGDGITVGNEG